MGRDKAQLEICGATLLVRTAHLLEPLATAVTVIGPVERYARLGLWVVPDDRPGLGPLGGIATALRISPLPWSLIVGCDLPFLTGAWLEYLIARAEVSTADVVVPESMQGPEPLCAIYHKRSEAAIAEALEQGVRKVTDALARLAMEKVLAAEWKAFDSDGWLFKNINMPADYEQARARLEVEPTK
jgi:molybdopterin-guanine dinucleotide biosynthesis protein A